MLNGKNLQPKILYPARPSIRIEGVTKEFPRQIKTVRVHDHYTSPAKNIKGDSFSGKERSKARKPRKEQRKSSETMTTQVIKWH